MIRAEVIIELRNFSGTTPRHAVTYDTVEEATAEYERVAELLKRRGDHANDLPPEVTLNGTNKITVMLIDIQMVGLVDYELSNESRKGLRETWPLRQSPLNDPWR
jgi:hypothetical protein